MTCNQCHQAQKKINELLQKTLKLAKDNANKIKERVIVFPTEKGYDFKPQSAYTGTVYTHKIDPDPS